MLTFSLASGQFQEASMVYGFGNRIDNPIELKVFERPDGFAFVATNRSFYCYELEISFSNLENLTPYISKKKMIVYQGRTELFKLEIIDVERKPYFEYTYRYSIGVPDKDVDYSYPYLIPVKNSFRYLYVNLHDAASDSIEKSSPYYEYIMGPKYNDTFVPNGNDTAYCMRKGYVAATPALYHKSDGLSDEKSIEVVHDDGSVMIYLNIRDDTTFVSAGTVIYPGQPLGIVKPGLGVTADLYQMIGDGHVKRVAINYYNGGAEPVPFKTLVPDSQVIWPQDLIFREMSKREQKRYKAGGFR